MKATLRISIWLNLALLGGVIFILVHQRKGGVVAAPPTSSETKPPVPVAAAPAPAKLLETESEPFHWSQLVSSKDYRIYVANLRASGCPEATVEDIVRGDTGRAFSWERSQLGLDGSGVGPWSRQSEMQLVASLLNERPSAAGTIALAQSAENRMEANGVNGIGNEVAATTAKQRGAENQAQGNGGGEVAENPAPTQSAESAPPAYPLFLQSVNWSAFGFDTSQQAAIAQVRQQFLNQINTPNGNSSAPADSSPNGNGSAKLPQWQTALQTADDQLRGLLGTQGYLAYQYQQYLNWYQPQVVANAGGGNLTIGVYTAK